MSHITFMSLAAVQRAQETRTPSVRHAQAQRFKRAGAEPTLRELLSDPLTHAVMARDKVTVHDLQAVVRQARDILRARKNAA